MRAAVRVLRKKAPARIIVAVPVGAASICEELRSEADEVICGKELRLLGSIGGWYEDFTQITDEEVCNLLKRKIPLAQ